MKYFGPIDLTQYYIKGYSMTDSEVIFGYQGVKVEFTLGRNHLNQFITVFLPCFALNIISFSSSAYWVKITFYYFDHSSSHGMSFAFQKEEFKAVVTVNVTIILAMTTLFISVSNSLPRSAHVKMIEVFLLCSMSMPLSEVLFIAALDVLR